jgi:hypothetical protein
LTIVGQVHQCLKAALQVVWPIARADRYRRGCKRGARQNIIPAQVLAQPQFLQGQARGFNQSRGQVWVSKAPLNDRQQCLADRRSPQAYQDQRLIVLVRDSDYGRKLLKI